MSLETLADSSAVVWRPVPTRPSTGAREPRTIYTRGVRISLAIFTTAEQRRPVGPGTRDAAQRKAVCPDGDARVMNGAILDVDAGSRRGERWRVVSVERPRGRITEMVVEPWTQDIPTEAVA